MSDTPPRPAACVILAPGARAAEQRLLSEIEGALPAGAAPPRPVRVVVPSHSLREHLLARLAERRRAWLGLEVASLAALARTILERTGGAPPSGAPFEGLFAARLAARETWLARSLGGLARGYDEILGAVHDLLDAGFVEAHLPAVEERLALEREGAGRPAVARARALARVAAGVRRELAGRGLLPGADLLAEAARRLDDDPERALPSHAVFVHGFADATGVATDLLEALVRRVGARVVIDTPPAPAGGPADWRFGRRLIERLRGAAPVEAEAAAPLDRTRAVERFRAADPLREARAAVGWLRADENVAARPESVALVARDVAGDLGRLAAESARQALPASAQEGLPSPRAAIAAGLLSLLERRAETPIGVVLALAAARLEDVSGVRAAELALACALGEARTLGAAARLEPESRRLPVPARLVAAAGSSPEVELRVVPEAAVAAARDLFASLLRAVSGLARAQPLSEALTRLRRLLDVALPPTSAEEFAAALAGLEAAADLTVEAGELARLAEAAWSALATQPLGGGSGVALLSVTEARGRTFERLAVIGLVRDRFPRPIRPDPLLPDALRARLRDLLPDLPVKAEGHDEERFLFAQLLAAAPRVALFRPLVDEDGRALPPSPLPDELAPGSAPGETLAPAPGVLSALDHAIGAALAGGLDALATPLAAAHAEAARRFGGVAGESASVVAARLAALAEHDAAPGGHAHAALGAFLGRVGPATAADPRQAPPPVTTLEALARCGWRAFLGRLLRLSPLPDLGESVPSLPGRLAGTVVHRVLERIFAGEERGAVALDTALRGDAVACRWPDESRLSRELRAAVRRALAREGLDRTLFEETLVREAGVLLEVARAADWADGARELLAVEATGEARFRAAGRERTVRFRVDRVERVAGLVLLTDYKTGHPLSTAVTGETLLRHLLAGIARGEWLQLPVYLRGAGTELAQARYLQLAPDLDDRSRTLALDSGALAGSGVEAALDALFAAWDAGAFVPRLLEPDLRRTFSGCASCDVREACVQGDSGARLRLERWAGTAGGSDGFDRAARGWWALRGPGPGAGGRE